MGCRSGWSAVNILLGSIFAQRGDRYKYIHYYGIWDIDELYDLQEDPLETNNLIFSEKHQPVIQDMNKKLFATFGESGGMYITLYPDTGAQMNRGIRMVRSARIFRPS